MRFMAIEKGENRDDFIHPMGVETNFCLYFISFVAPIMINFQLLKTNVQLYKKNISIRSIKLGRKWKNSAIDICFHNNIVALLFIVKIRNL